MVVGRVQSHSLINNPTRVVLLLPSFRLEVNRDCLKKMNVDAAADAVLKMVMNAKALRRELPFLNLK